MARSARIKGRVGYTRLPEQQQTNVAARALLLDRGRNRSHRDRGPDIRPTSRMRNRAYVMTGVDADLQQGFGEIGRLNLPAIVPHAPRSAGPSREIERGQPGCGALVNEPARPDEDRKGNIRHDPLQCFRR